MAAYTPHRRPRAANDTRSTHRSAGTAHRDNGPGQRYTVGPAPAYPPLRSPNLGGGTRSPTQKAARPTPATNRDQRGNSGAQRRRTGLHHRPRTKPRRALSTTPTPPCPSVGHRPYPLLHGARSTVRSGGVRLRVPLRHAHRPPSGWVCGRASGAGRACRGFTGPAPSLHPRLSG